eukprot:scaffold5135_cov131-Skeletonema_dohrnii-CCMP3373.AAC.1
MYYNSSSSNGSEGSVDDESSVSSSEEESGLDMVKRNDPRKTGISYGDIQHVTEEESWEELGRDISNNTHLDELFLCAGALDQHKMSLLFRGLTRSSSINSVTLYRDEFSVPGVRSMVPFLENANNLTYLCVNDNNLQSEGFNLLFRALRDSPVETLCCAICDIGSIEIDADNFPRNLMDLDLSENSISADGCEEIAKLLQGGGSTLTKLDLTMNNIHDNGAAILADALRNNTSLATLQLTDNMVTIEGAKLFLQLVNDVSSIKATQESNRTLRSIRLEDWRIAQNVKEQIQRHIDKAAAINFINANNPEVAGRAKVVRTLLNSANRAELMELQGVNQSSLYGEINSLHLPEVLALIGEKHGQGELYIALKLSIAGVISMVTRTHCLQERRVYHRARLEAVEAEIAGIDTADGGVAQVTNESRSSKRRRS